LKTFCSCLGRSLLVVSCWLAAQSISRAVVVTNVADLQAAITNGGLITFSTNATYSVTNPLVIVTNTVIDGLDQTITISGSSTTRVFTVTTNVTLTLLNITVANGRHTNGGAGIFVSTGGTLNLSNCTLFANDALGANGKNGLNETSGDNGGNGGTGVMAIGGAIYNLGTVNITNSTLEGNTAWGGDGGRGGNGGNDSLFGGNGGNGGIGAIGWGGGIYNTGTVFIINSTFEDNFALGGFGGEPGAGGAAPFPGEPGTGGGGAVGLGGGIYNLGTVIIVNSTFFTNNAVGGDSMHAGFEESGKNGAAGLGGGIYNLGTLSISNSTFFRNAAEGGKGGDVFNGDFLEGGNGGAGNGGAVYHNSATTNEIVSCTFATNSAVGGPGGISPITANTGSVGQSLGGNIYRLLGQVRLRNTILAKGSSGANYSGTTTGIDGGYNISSDGSCSFTATFGSRNNLNALLGSLAANGGPTKTMAIPTNSPAFNKGDPAFRNAFDQRGVSRMEGTNTDIGAFEFAPNYIIQGKIFNETNGALSNIVVSVGDDYATTTSTTNGSYVFNVLPGEYVVTPTPVRAGFTPSNQTVVVGLNAIDPSGNVSNVNFVANQPFSVSGKIVEVIGNMNNGISNIVVSAGGKTAISQTNGIFSISNLVAGPHIVTPSPVGAGFNPVSTNITLGTNAMTANVNDTNGNVTNLIFFANQVAITFSVGVASTNISPPTNGVLTLQFAGIPQRSYRVQSKTNLNSTNWTTIATNVADTNGLFKFSQTNLMLPAQRFFRTVNP
jgi:hypothetical protein